MNTEACEIKEETSAESVCRLCFTEREHYRLIFIDAYSSLDQWIENLTSLKIINVPGAPGSLCLECESTLQNFESFREMCFTNDRVFKEMFPPNDHTAVSKSSLVISEVKIDHSESQETDLVDFTIDIPVEETAMNIAYEDINTRFKNKVSCDENYHGEKHKLESETEHHKSIQNIAEENDATVHQTNVVRAVEIRDYNISRIDQLAQNTETAVKYRDMNRKCDVDGQLSSAKNDDAITKSGNSLKQKKHPPLKCEFCFKKFNVKHKYHNHIRRHRVEKSHICSYCDKGFISSAELNVHIRTHTLERPFKCNNCDKSFKTTSHLSRHIRCYCKVNKSPHHKKQILHCESCSKTFTAKWRFEAHTRSHTMDAMNSCSVCSKSFKDSAGLKIHIRTHTRERSFKCNLCDKSFFTSSLLARHHLSYCEGNMQQNDVQEKSYKCDKCDACFETTILLMQHMRFHHGVKPYTCDVCQSTFSTSGNLIRHKQHAKRHTYTCEVCQLKFTLPEHLERHKKEHSDQIETGKNPLDGF